MEPGTSEWTTVMNRLERLEKQNRRMKQIGVLALILVGAVLLMGQASSKRTVEANEFILKDDSGKTRADLIIQDNAPMFRLYDANGKSRAMMDASPNGPGLYLSDANGKIQAALDLYPGAAGLFLGSPKGKDGAYGASLIVDSGMPVLTLADEIGKPRALLSGEPSLQLSDEEGFEATIGASNLVSTRTGEKLKTSAASVVLFGKEKKVLWQAP